MRLPRLRRSASACRLYFPLFLLTLAACVSVPTRASAASLSGRVLDPDGRPVPGARVLVTTILGTVAERPSDSQGQFLVDPLPPGDFQLFVVADGFQGDPVTVTVRDTPGGPVDLKLRVSAVRESIVVSASQVAVPLSRVADPVTVLTAADLEARQIERVSDALRLVPGLAVARSGGAGAITSMFPRGGGSNYTLVLVDGMRVNAFGGGFDFGHLSVADIDRIEIVRNPDSAVFGSDAIGAVVQVITRRGGAPRGEGLVEGGSFGTGRAAVSTSGAQGAWSWGGGAETSRSTGFTGTAPASGEKVSNDDDHLTTASGSLGWSRAGGADAVFTARIAHDERGYPGPFGSNPIAAFSGVDRVSRGNDTTKQVGLRVSHAWTPMARQRVEASYTDVASDFASAFGTSTSGTKRLDARVQEDVALSKAFAASAGVNVVREEGTSTYVTGLSATPLPIQRAVAGLFGEVRYVGSERLMVTAGVRLEHITRSAVEANTGTYTARPAFPDDTMNAVSPRLSVGYLLAGRAGSREQTRLRASIGTGIRPPDVFEIAFTDNPSLKPERSRTLDVGVEQQLSGGTAVVSATAFFNTFNDLIITVGRSMQNASRYKTDNISNAKASGLELEGRLHLPAGFDARLSYAFVATEMLSVTGLDRVAPSGFAVGDPLLRRPRHQGAVDLTYAAHRLTAFTTLTTRGEALDVEPNYGSFGGLFYNPGSTVVNAGASYALRPTFSVYARVLNLANRTYEEVLGFPAPGRSAIVGLRIATGR